MANGNGEKGGPLPDVARPRSGGDHVEAVGIKGPSGPLDSSGPPPTAEGRRAFVGPTSKEAAEGDAPRSEWTKVVRRLRTKDRIDQRSFVVWGLPHGVDPGHFESELQMKAAKCWWRGSDTTRHMVVEFANSMIKMPTKSSLRTNAAPGSESR